MKKSDIATSLWNRLLYCYGQHGRNSVEVPTEDVLEVLSSLMANVLSGVSDAREREDLIRDIAPRVERMVNRVRQRPDIHIPPSGLILPN